MTVTSPGGSYAAESRLRDKLPGAGPADTVIAGAPLREADLTGCEQAG
jgi:hypothetical protein